MGCRQPEVGGWAAGGVDGRAASGGRPAIYIRTHADMQAENLHAATARWVICALADGEHFSARGCADEKDVRR